MRHPCCAYPFRLYSFRIPYTIQNIVEKFREMDSSTDSANTNGNGVLSGPAFLFAQFLALVTGLLIPVIYVVDAVTLSLQKTKYYHFDAMGLVRWVLSSSNKRAEARLKWAGIAKVNRLLVNAHRLHKVKSVGGNYEQIDKAFEEVTESKFPDRATASYLLHGEQEEPSGGLLWTWTRILNGTIFDVEGLWFSTRLIWFQVAQAVFATVLSVLLFQGVGAAADRAQTTRDELDPALPQWYIDLIPTRQTVQGAFYPAWATAVAVMILLIGVYVPR